MSVVTTAARREMARRHRHMAAIDARYRDLGRQQADLETKLSSVLVAMQGAISRNDRMKAQELADIASATRDALEGTKRDMTRARAHYESWRDAPPVEVEPVTCPECGGDDISAPVGRYAVCNGCDADISM